STWLGQRLADALYQARPERLSERIAAEPSARTVVIDEVQKAPAPLDAPAEIEGMGLEGLVAQHLRAWIAYRGGAETLHYWRTRAGREVDFVVYGPGTVVALEVKRSRSVQRRDLAGLKAFREDYPESEAALLHLGREPLL
ncbi:MAG: DUF4143 domain-containing protein, partial [Prochlorococcaceae cyanobacterium]